MIAEKLDVIPECDVAPILETVSMPVNQETISLIPETDSASLVQENDSPKVVSGSSVDSPKAVCGSADSNHGHVRRYSTGNIGGNVGIPYKSVKILSRYLAASTGSCHDNCKYGTRQDFKTKTPNIPTLAKRVEKPGKSQEIGKTVTLAERKMKLAASSTPSPGSKSQKPDFPVITKTEVSSPAKRETVLLKQFLLPLKGVVQKPKPTLSKSSSLPIKKHWRGKEDGDELYKGNDKGTPLLNSPRASSSREPNKHKSINKVKTSVLDEKKVGAGSTVSLSALHTVRKVLARPIASLSSKRSDKRVSNTYTEKFKSRKGVSHSKDHSDTREAEPEHPSSEDVPEKTLYVIESSAENRTAAATENSDFSASLSSLSKDKSLKHVQASSPLSQKILRLPQFGIYNSRLPSCPEKKSLRHIKQETRGSRSSITSLTSSKSKQSGGFPEYYKTDNAKSAVTAKVDLKNSLRKGGVISTKNKGSPIKKLSFWKGRVVEHGPEVSSPRRLKFRRRLSKRQIGTVETIESKLKNTETHVDDDDVVAKSECSTVVLKHQNVEEKKAAKKLLNNMIEETANKLAETKKSKVKALVGAFETVISLQDSRQSSTD